MDSESRNLQNDFLNAARRDKSTVTVFLGNGKRLTGRLKSFDRFTLLLESHQGEQIVFKHAISTVSTVARPAETTVEEPQHEPVAAAVGHQPARRTQD
jgi:host factor-I protein